MIGLAKESLVGSTFLSCSFAASPLPNSSMIPFRGGRSAHPSSSPTFLFSFSSLFYSSFFLFCMQLEAQICSISPTFSTHPPSLTSSASGPQMMVSTHVCMSHATQLCVCCMRFHLSHTFFCHALDQWLFISPLDLHRW
jgi:hypothetical protein